MGATSPGKQIRNHEPADSPVYPDDYAVTYTQIAESLASHFDLIYYISCDNSNYVELSTRKKSGELKVQDQGNDFFAASQSNLDRLIDSEDRDRLRLFLDRDRLISRLENTRQLTEDYRMILGDGKRQYTRMSVSYSSDRSHFIICIENRDQYVRREQEHLAARKRVCRLTLEESSRFRKKAAPSVS